MSFVVWFLEIHIVAIYAGLAIASLSLGYWAGSQKRDSATSSPLVPSLPRSLSPTLLGDDDASDDESIVDGDIHSLTADEDCKLAREPP